jgi:hypothetical protein
MTFIYKKGIMSTAGKCFVISVNRHQERDVRRSAFVKQPEVAALQDLLVYARKGFPVCAKEKKSGIIDAG